MPLHGRLNIDGTSGALRSASFNAAGEMGDSAFDIRYAEEAAVGMSVPVEVRAVYRRPRKPKSDYMEVVSHYSNFRRFEVSVQESIELPTSKTGR